jgi:NADH-quinone oxidoreductase subunit K
MILGDLGLTVASILLAIGAYGLVNSKNIIRILLSSEIIVNASILMVFSASSLLNKVYLPIFFSIFAIGMALIEVVVAFAAIFLYYRSRGSLEVE